MRGSVAVWNQSREPLREFEVRSKAVDVPVCGLGVADREGTRIARSPARDTF